MDKTGKKFISPFNWFSLVYPQNWYEFEDTEGTFLFYNPGKWNGNFRISAYKAEPKLPDSMKYAVNSIREELKNNTTASLVKVGNWECAYSKETFQEGDTFYTTHIWITGINNIVFECTFTVPKGGDKMVAEEIIRTLEARFDSKKYPLEVIPVRILEVGVVNDAFEWTSTTVKKLLKKDFTGTKEDIKKLQQLIDACKLNLNQKDISSNLGITLGVIFVNEIDGIDWVTVIDGNREFVALRYQETDFLIYPQQMIEKELQKEKTIDLLEEFEKMTDQLSSFIAENE